MTYPITWWSYVTDRLQSNLTLLDAFLGGFLTDCTRCTKSPCGVCWIIWSCFTIYPK